MKKKDALTIILKGCREHNLKNISLSVPKQAITVITGVSGSGKSSLAFDTLYAEGQRRYLANLSAAARALIKQIPKPEVDLIEGLAPTLAINHGRSALYVKGIVATYTDIYDLLSLLFVNIGEQHSPSTGKRLRRFTRQEIVEHLLKEMTQGTRFQLIAPIKLQRENAEQALTRLQQMGFVRFRINDKDWSNDESPPEFSSIQQLDVIVDRLEVKEGIRDRLAHSIETALNLSQGRLKVQEGRSGPVQWFTEIYVCPETGVSFAPLKVNDFNFNSPHGACPVCLGIGGQELVDLSLLNWDLQQPLLEQIKKIFEHFPKKLLRIWLEIFHAFAKHEFLTDKTFLKDVSNESMQKLLNGTDHSFVASQQIGKATEHVQAPWKGLIPLVNASLSDKTTKGSLSDLPFVTWQTCPACQGARLKPESLACLIQGKNIQDLCSLSVTDLYNEISSWKFSNKQAKITAEIIPPILSRLQFLEQVGLGYLELNRPGGTLSDGEAQRIQLASQIGAKLSGIIYILDEPSLGLHRKDVQHLLQVIKELKSLNNTLILVEHEKSLISSADHIIEMGPGAGIHGGELLFQGNYQELLKNRNSPTGNWLNGTISLPKPSLRKSSQRWLEVSGASLHNLKNFSVKIPLNCLVGFCGVSGSGKSTLVMDIIGTQIKKALMHASLIPGLKDPSQIQRLVISEKQNERVSPRSIPATYVGIMTPLRQLFAETRLAKARGYTASRFSLNKRGGRCEACEGLGQVRVNMQLMPDLYLPCEVCQGLRYNHETCQITWENLNIAQVLELSIEEAAKVFDPIPTISSKLELMRDLGLDYLTLGQPFTTLSTGEIQRLRLAADLADPSVLPTLYLLDEPSAGLHFQDICKLVAIFHRLVNKGHSIFLIEHHLDVLSQADWLIELGPGPGPQGGKLIFEGPLNKFLQTSTPTSALLH